tara:strand:+ start:5053 stop:5466 length:414 start_codon:yes stop_codon:yes gene_type:complete
MAEETDKNQPIPHDPRALAAAHCIAKARRDCITKAQQEEIMTARAAEEAARLENEAARAAGAAEAAEAGYVKNRVSEMDPNDPSLRVRPWQGLDPRWTERAGGQKKSKRRKSKRRKSKKKKTRRKNKKGKKTKTRRR